MKSNRNDTPNEEEIMPGIYITDFRKIKKHRIKSISQQVKLKKATENKNNQPIKLSREEILNFHEMILNKEKIIVRLLKTNKEIKEFDPSGEDADFQKALRDNMQSILNHSDEIKHAKYQLEMSGNLPKQTEDDEDLPVPELGKIIQKEELEGEEEEEDEKKKDGDDDDNGIYL